METALIGARPPAESQETAADDLVDIAGTIADARLRRQRIIEQTRASLGELRFQKSRMHDALVSIRSEVEFARTFRSGTGLGSAPKRPLSHAEIRVLKEVAAGLPNKQIAVGLGISERTVRNHMTEIFARLRVNNRTAAVLRALRLGLLIV